MKEQTKPIIDIEEIIDNQIGEDKVGEVCFTYKETKNAVKEAISKSLDYIIQRIGDEIQPTVDYNGWKKAEVKQLEDDINCFISQGELALIKESIKKELSI